MTIDALTPLIHALQSMWHFYPGLIVIPVLVCAFSWARTRK